MSDNSPYTASELTELLQELNRLNEMGRKLEKARAAFNELRPLLLRDYIIMRKDMSKEERLKNPIPDDAAFDVVRRLGIE